MVKRLVFHANPFEINLPWGNVERAMPCTTPSMPTKMRSGARAASIGIVLERAAFAPLRACSVIPVPQRTRDLRSRFSRVQCPISPAILLFPRDWSMISAPGVAWSAFCAPGTCSVQLPAECLRSSPCVRARYARHRSDVDGTVSERNTPVEWLGTHRCNGSRSRSRRENYVKNERDACECVCE